MGSIVVGLVIIAIVAFVINSMIKDKKSGSNHISINKIQNQVLSMERIIL